MLQNLSAMPCLDQVCRGLTAIVAPHLQVGSNYFRIHPKGVGLKCCRSEGLPPLTFVEEYLGEVHTPWRWFEMQVSLLTVFLAFLANFWSHLMIVHR